MHYSTLIILVISNLVVNGTKVIERFGGFYSQDLPCKLWLPHGFEVARDMRGTLLNPSLVVDPLKKLNCTFFRAHADEFGHPLANGSYTGLIGMVQRRESDVILVAVGPDSLPHEPALIGPIVLEADAAIISGKSKQHRITREILALVNDVDPLVYTYLIISIIIFSVCYTMSILLELSRENETEDDDAEQGDWDAVTVAKCLLKMIWKSFGAVFGGEQFSPGDNSGRILSLFFTLGLFFGIYGMFLNNVGADLIRRNGPPNIDSIDYFINNITHTKPVIVKKLYLLNLLKSEPRNSTLGKLWSLMEKEQNDTVLDVDKDRLKDGDDMYRMQVVGIATDVLWEVQTRKKAIIMPRSFARNSKMVGCTMNPVNISRLYVSKESFAAGTLNTLMSHGIHPEIRKIFEYFGRAFHEAALMEGIARLYALDAENLVPGADAKLGLSALECMEGKPLTVMKDDPELAAEVVTDNESFQEFSLFHLESLFKLWFFGLFAALVLFILEIFYEYCKLSLHFFLA